MCAGIYTFMGNIAFNLFLCNISNQLCDLDDLLSLTIQQCPESLAQGEGKVRGFPKKRLRLTMKNIKQYMSGIIL
jgi:hypothetical protein